MCMGTGASSGRSAPSPGPKNRWEKEEVHFLNPTPQTQHPDRNREEFLEPERRTERQTGRQTASPLEKFFSSHFGVRGLSWGVGAAAV